MSETYRPEHAPADHPPVMRPKIGILVANLGTPEGTDYWSMRRYLNEFLSDRRVVDYPAWKWQPILKLFVLTRRPFSSGRNYRSIWNTEADESPMMTITKRQVAALRAAAAERYGDAVMVDFCMRYGKPSTQDVVERMVAEGCTKIVFVPLYPQYAGATWATANDQFFRALMTIKRQPAVRIAPEYFDHPSYIDALAQSVERVYAGLDRRPDVLVASFHGMPKRYLMEGDPYHCQCAKTVRLLRERLGWDKTDIDITFQSVFGPEEWLKPYTVEHVAELAKAGKRNIAIMSPAFSADCVETLEEVNGEIRHAFMAAGGETFTYIPCLNDEAAHIAALMEVISENLRGWIDV
ncbi:ferrochelatase [Paenirhodobacter enshiensis]|uniref:ferrochelatase n=1 Tax=Paenirhodobacter enshiensis TaxID=1105367 RepID=UPI0035AE8F76